MSVHRIFQQTHLKKLTSYNKNVQLLRHILEPNRLPGLTKLTVPKISHGYILKAREIFQANYNSRRVLSSFFTNGGSRILNKLAVASGITCGVLIGAFGSVIAESNVITEADELYEQNKHKDIYNLLITHKDSKDDEILWRLARATYEGAKAAKTDEEKKILYREALDYAEAALAVNESNFAVHKWMAILIDYVYGYEGTKARISQSFNVKHHMERAIELNPTDGTSRYLLGFWYFSVAGIPWYQRKVASVIFATPPSGTFEDALEHFLNAEKMDPNFYSKNLLMIGKSYLMIGKKELAKEYLIRARDYPQKTRDDRESKEQAEELLKGL